MCNINLIRICRKWAVSLPSTNSTPSCIAALRSLRWRRAGKQNDGIRNSGHLVPLQLQRSEYCPPPCPSPCPSPLPLRAGARDATPSRYLCPAMHSEQECCSAVHHMRIALCGMLG